MEFKKGDNIQDSTLYIEEICVNNKFICKCTKCGVADVYLKSELTEDYPRCKFCEEIRTLSDRLIKGDLEKAKKLVDRTYAEKLRAGSDYATSLNIPGYNIGDAIGDLNILCFIGKLTRDLFGQLNVSNPYKIMLQCKRCGYSKEVEIKKLNKIDTSCPNCSKLRKETTRRVQIALDSKKEHDKVILTNRIRKREQKMVPMSKVKSPLDNIKPGSKIEKHINNIKALNPNLQIGGVEFTGSAYTTQCICSRCGSEVVIPSTLKKKQVECVGCSKLKTNLNYKGTFQKDWVGFTKNNLTITGQSGLKCNVKCRMCGHIQNEVNLWDVLHGKLYCECELGNFDDIYYCNSCGKPMKIKLSQVIGKSDNSEDIVCNMCGKNSGVTAQEILNEQTAMDMKATTCNKLDIAIKDYKNAIVDINGLIKDKEPLYAGTDDVLYYKCRCLEHQTDLILNDMEIANFDHSQCEDGRQHIIKNIDVDNLKL